VSDTSRWTALRSRADILFRDHEIFVRTGGEVRFLRVSARAQKRVAWIAGSALGVWALATVGMVGWQAWSSYQNRDIIARQQAVAAAEARMAASRGRVARTASELEARQDAFEAMLGELGTTTDDATTPAEAPATTDGTVSEAAAPDEVSRLEALRARQARMIASLTVVFERRAARAADALRTVGINPSLSSSGGQGGPYQPFAALAATRDPAMRRLAAHFGRMQQLEELVLALPSFHPAQVERMSSGFGYRRDPFNGSGAMHAGQDFTGDHASPILAAAPGRISFVGRQGGYGNTVEIDHGHGIMTRYAHLSGFTGRVGEQVAAGRQIGRMGSTGRSTGTHLHFEVRVNGTAVNPRRFLEGNADVLEIQADAGRRPQPGARRTVQRAAQ
jgi:murein DD-endopeptidase MepM/ murein hydrolase activator NlpD